VTGPHVALAVLVACIWGVAFVATRIALDTFSPPLLAFLRFVIAAVPVLALARPPVPWPALILVGLFLFAGQFLFQFFGIALGMPPGLAAIVVQTQALYTILFAALALREWPSPRQLAGSALAFGGLVLIAVTVGGDLTVAGLALTTLSAISWGVGNVLLKRLPPADTVSLMVWLSLIPPLPALAIALAMDGPPRSSPPSRTPRGREWPPRSISGSWPPCWPMRSGAPSCAAIPPPRSRPSPSSCRSSPRRARRSCSASASASCVSPAWSSSSPASP